VIQRRSILLAAAVTLLLAVVAVVARGRPLGSGSHGHGGLPLSFWDYAYTTIVIVGVPLLISGVIAMMFVRRRQKKPRLFWQSMLRVFVFYCLLVAAELLIARYAHFHLHRHPLHQTQTGRFKSGQSRESQSGTGSRSLRFQWGELIAVLALVAVVAAAAVVAARRSRPDDDTGLEAAPEALAAALDESLDDLRGDPDLRRAIIAAYARMETALAAAGIPRRPAEAPLEYVERALLTLDASAAAVRHLTDLFEWARFSHHEPEPSMRDDAVDALVAVRDELRASELTPA
jgi:Domain of unknown function (DUF4129)